MQVTASDPSINMPSYLTLQIQTLMPIEIGSNIEITIPVDFTIENGALESVTTLGSSLDSDPTWTYDDATRTISVTAANIRTISSLGFMTFVVGPVINPGQSNPTESFTYLISDPQGAPVEQALDGITFQATAGGFASAILVEADAYTINKSNVAYTFTFQPQDDFNSNAIMKLVLPSQLYINEAAYIQTTEGAISNSQDLVTVLFNRIVYIYNAFPSGYTAGAPFTFKLKGFTNPQNSQPTDSFEVKIFYEEYTNEVSHYLGQDLVFTATASTDITLESYLTESMTGESQTNFTIVGNMGDEDYTIEKQSYLKVFIPKDFQIDNALRVASTCIPLWGFSDELLCEVVATSLGYNLFVRNGFDS
jgi:hypothetical protein